MKKNMGFILLFYFLFNLSLSAQESDKPIALRGEKTAAVWIWGKALSSEPIDSVVHNLKHNYVNEVYLLVKGGAGKTADSSLLSEFIRLAHSSNIKVHFWYIVGSDSVFLSLHPEAHIYHCPKPSSGFTSPYPDRGSSVNLLYPGYKDYVLNKIAYFLNNFNYDGIHLDVIRFPNLTFSFDNYSLEKAQSLGINTKRILNFFNEDYDFYVPKGGVTEGGLVKLYKDGDSDVVGWVNMRKNIVYDYIKSIKNLIQKVKPGLPLTAAFMPEATLDPLTADVYYAQSYSLNSPLLDAIMPMAYFDAFGKPTSWLKDITEGAIKQVDPKCKIITGIQTYDEVTPQEVKEQIDYSLQGGASGIIIFRYGTTTPDEWKVIREMFNERRR
jgi:uncharacterized lipoprotein YddW (UPF0748 family)